MKIKHQLSIFNALTRLLIVLVLWFILPLLVKKVVYNHIDNGLLEKKEKFIEHLNDKEIHDFIVRNDSSETYASFSMLHNDFVVLSRLLKNNNLKQTLFINEVRVIDGDENEYRILQYNFPYKNYDYQLEVGSSLVEIKELTFIIRLFTIIVLIITIIITFLLDTFFVDYLFKPFYTIIDTKIKRVNELETFDHQPIVSYSSEFQELDTVLNQMVNRISELFKKEKQFIANVSHEMLTPIALLNNRFENLLQNSSLNDDAIDKIAGSLRVLDMLKKIINSLLLISRIDNNQYQANESIDLNDLIEGLKKDLKDRFEDKNIKLSIELKNRVLFTGNKTLLYILLYNLLVNAIKYNKPDGSILVKDGFERETYYLLISDTGIGMDELYIESIFKRFSRINKEEEGQGLGLAIVDSIAHFHKIKINVESKLNEGTTFKLLFPII